MDKKKNQKETFIKVLKYVKKYWGFVVLSLVFAAVSVAFSLYIPILTGRAIDQIVGKGNVDFVAVLKIIKQIIVVIGITVDHECL